MNKVLERAKSAPQTLIHTTKNTSSVTHLGCLLGSESVTVRLLSGNQKHLTALLRAVHTISMVFIPSREELRSFMLTSITMSHLFSKLSH